jgi:hypothetical protein
MSTINKSSIDTVDCIVVFTQEHQRQVYRQEHRVQKLNYTHNYSVTLHKRLISRWTAEIDQDLKAFHGISC